MYWGYSVLGLYVWINSMAEEKYLQVTSGRGPKECNLAVSRIVNSICAEGKKYAVHIAKTEVEEIDGFPCSVILRLVGMNLAVFIERWKGTICWVCKSPFRPLHKRKNWFVEVKPYQPFDCERVLDLKEVNFQSMRSSGAGGQHVNKVSSAIRATHLPTGISVQVMDTRSQLQNKEIAIRRLNQRLKELELAELNSAKGQKWRDQIEIKRGQAKRIFFGPQFLER